MHETREKSKEGKRKEKQRKGKKLCLLMKFNTSEKRKYKCFVLLKRNSVEILT